MDDLKGVEVELVHPNLLEEAWEEHFSDLFTRLGGGPVVWQHFADMMKEYKSELLDLDNRRNLLQAKIKAIEVVFYG